MFYQIFFSPQVKRCAIITNKHGIYELPQELPNESWEIRKLGNMNESQEIRKLGNIRKVSKPQRMIAQCLVPPLK